MSPPVFVVSQAGDHTLAGGDRDSSVWSSVVWHRTVPETEPGQPLDTNRLIKCTCDINHIVDIFFAIGYVGSSRCSKNVNITESCVREITGAVMSSVACRHWPGDVKGWTCDEIAQQG